MAIFFSRYIDPIHVGVDIDGFNRLYGGNRWGNFACKGSAVGSGSRLEHSQLFRVWPIRFVINTKLSGAWVVRFTTPDNEIVNTRRNQSTIIYNNKTISKCASREMR